MKRIARLSLTLLLLSPPVILNAAIFHVAPSGSDANATTRAISAPVETDARLHADGPGWRLEKARITEQKLPRVLFIGDSILQGYMGTAINGLKGKANVDVWVTPLWQSERFNNALADVIDQGPYDVIHMNIGLHGWPEGRIKPGTYEPLTRAFLDVIRKKAPRTKVVWASSTPTFNKQNFKEFNSEINPIIVGHNKMAARIMEEYGVPINDFYGLLVDKSNLVRADGVHWNSPAMKMLAEVAVKSILRELKQAPETHAATLPAAGTTSNLDLEGQFKTPPLSSRVQAYWFWMGSNISKEGMTKDLEAMRDAGLGGALIMHVSNMVGGRQPWPDRTYRSEYYWAALKHAAAEADRLGLKLTLTNGPGWDGTGGPWIDEKRNMRRLVWSSLKCDENSPAELVLPKPPQNPKAEKFYEEIAVLAVPDAKTVRLEQIVDLSARMQPDGRLNWSRPAGKWVVCRIGSTPTLAGPHPVVEGADKALEVDKLSEEHNLFHWQKGVIEPLKEHLGNYYGTSLNSLHVDSYECGMQNWTRTFREVFVKRKGYDPVPWLATFGPPVLGWPQENMNGKPITGLPRNEQSKFIDSEEKTLRFEWDFRENVNRMFNDCFRTAKKLMNADKVLFSYEAYGGPFNSYEAAAIADVSMPVFGFDPDKDFREECGPTASMSGTRAAGRTLVGSEAFTGDAAVCKWTECPALMKFRADGAFASGVNRLTFHHWSHQPFDDKYQPGMGMSHYGVHLSRFQTWFEPGKAFFAYLNRCQFLLQHGEEVVDCLSLDKETGYSDVITSHDFVNDHTHVENGQIVLASGRRYFYLSVPGDDFYQVKPSGETMLPEVAEKLLCLVQAGAVIVVPKKPSKSPSLQGYPECDRRVAAVAQELWDSGRYTNHVFATVREATKALGLEPDYIRPSGLKVLHRRSAEADIYFVTNRTTAEKHSRLSVRISGRQPELWQAEDASIVAAPVWEQTNGRTVVHLDLAPKQSVFVVFRKKTQGRVHPTEIAVKEPATQWCATMNENGRPGLCAADDVTAQVKYSDGTTKQVRIAGAKQTTLNGGWQVAFNPKIGEPFRLELPGLADFSKHTENRVRFFSGTAIYRKAFKLDALQENEGVVLDLGELYDIASVRVNGAESVVLWYAPYRLDITKHLKAGDNVIEVSVTNNWANAIIGDEQIPADYRVIPRRVGTFLREFPDWFLKDQPRPSARKTFTFPANYYSAESKPNPAGLVGPVRLQFQQRMGL